MMRAKQRFYGIYSFLLSFASMIVFLSCAGYLTGGEYSIVRGDLLENYLPAIQNLCRDLLNRESIFYSWNYGLGVNTSLYNAYYSYSPFNFIYILLYDFDVSKVTVLVVLVKVALAALCFHVFISQAYGITGVESIVFSVFYSMCSYQMVFNIISIIWLDALIVLPLVMLFVKMIVENRKKWIFLSISYSFIFISQFYMGYMIGGASVLYLMACLVLYSKEGEIKRAVKDFVLAVLLAIGISACVWLPAILFLPESYQAIANAFPDLSKNILDIFNRVFWGEGVGIDNRFPYIYCGIPTIGLTIVYFCDKHNRVKDRIVFGSMLVVLILSCVLKPLYAVWHAFDVPNMYQWRFSFVISFWLCVIAAIEVTKFLDGKKYYIGVIFALLLLYVIQIFWQKTRVPADMQFNTWLGLLVNSLFSIGWMAIVLCYKRYGVRFGKVIVILALLLVSTEVISNGQYNNKKTDQVLKETIDDWDLFQRWVVEQLKHDNSLYRVCYWQDISSSAGTMYGYNNIAYFGSAENVCVREVLGKLGVSQSPRVLTSRGITPITKMLIDVKYDAFGEKPVVADDGTIGYTVALDENLEYLGIGYMVAGEIDDYSFETNNAFENTNHLLSLMTGEDIVAYCPIEPSKLSISGNGIDLSNDGERYVLSVSDDYQDNDDELFLSFEVHTDTVDNYAYIENTLSLIRYDTYMISRGDELDVYSYGGPLSSSYIKKMYHEDDYYSLRIYSDGYTGEAKFDDIYFCSYDDNERLRVYDTLRDEVLAIDDFKDGYLRGHISIASDKRVLFTSIPYERGWKAYVNGEPYEIMPILDDAFISLELPGNGEYDIELIFDAPGAKSGIIVSCISLMLGVAVFINMMIESRRKKQ